MLSFSVLSSGSRANSILVQSGETKVLVDCGLSAKQAAVRLESHGITADQIDAIVLSHEHEDHSSGVRVFSKRHGTPVYVNPTTHQTCRHLTTIPLEKIIHFESGEDFTIGGLCFSPFSLVHDAGDPVGFRITGGERTLAIATDLGQVTNLVRERLRDIDALILESNHDKLLLQDAPYPWSLKQRISSSRGHLSNDCAAELIEYISRSEGQSRLQIAVAAHISEKSNTPELAVEVLSRAWRRGGAATMPRFLAATADRCTPIFEL